MDAWSVVGKKGKKKGDAAAAAYARAQNRGSNNNKKTTPDNHHSTILIDGTAAEEEEYSEKKVRQLLKDALGIVRVFESSLFLKHIIDSIDNSSVDNSSSSGSSITTTAPPVISHMVSLGIGKFSESRPALLQLSLAACIGRFYKLTQRNMDDTNDDGNSSINNNSNNNNEYNNNNDNKQTATSTTTISRCEIFDPLFGRLERAVCASLGFSVCESNRKGKHNVSNIVSSGSGRALFFMPHCPYRLYCNLLWSNWQQLDCLVIIGNSFQNYYTRRVGTDLSSGDLVVRLREAFSETAIDSSLLSEDEAERLQRAGDAFSDISLHRVSAGAAVCGVPLAEVLLPGEEEMDMLCMLDGEVRD